ncbi:hypothetical protein [Pseudoduganella namucuonensis]|uniref:hypothetical protein n=1 Tax=Pseudoduganella namucuonensis TaxID=1035707 RepID=UPI0011608DEC|nr:hypothetical protein [Pseudoduganella namucuonensis]
MVLTAQAPKETCAPYLLAGGCLPKPGKQGVGLDMLERGVDHLQIHSLMAQRELQVADKRVLERHSRGEKDTAITVDSPIHGPAPDMPDAQAAAR